MDEGYIKFNIEHCFEEILIPDIIFNELNVWRTKLFDLMLIGETPEGIGYGNISVKTDNGFFITGSATGKQRVLNKKDYALVYKYNLFENKVYSKGMCKASSESMSHAAVYESDMSTNAVIHVHSEIMWNKYLNSLPVTSKLASFGTPEMALEIKRILKDTGAMKSGILIMGGHKDGIITFGKNLNEAGETLMKFI